MKQLLTVMTGGVLAVSAAGPAYALEATVSGQVNRALMYADDGRDTELHHVDNSISSTRFRFDGEQEISAGLKAGIVFEVEYQSNPSSDVSQTVRSIAPTLAERHMNVYLTDGFGTISLGQGDGAANGGTEVDLSGTVVAHWSGVNSIGGGIEFRDPAGGFGPAIGDVINNQDFESRYDRLHYQTPAFGPLKLAASTGVKDDEDAQEAALWFSGDIAGGKLAAAIGFSSQDRAADVDDEVVGGSISWLGAGGFSVTLATTTRDIAADREGEFMYVKLGYKTGQHALAVDYGTGDDFAQTGDEADMVGLGYVYMPAKWAELYAAAKQHSLDRPGADFDDIRIFMVGSRLKF